MIRKIVISAFMIMLLSVPALAADSNAIAEGFYNFSLIFDKNDIGKENIFHGIVTADWKKDLLAWCRKNKEQIETNPDPQLVYSSIAVSHFDNLMELASKSQALSENILSALSKAIKAKADFQDGNCPDLVNGLNKIRIKRFEGASVAEFVIHFPETYHNSRKWPMLVYVRFIFCFKRSQDWSSCNWYP